MNDFLDQITDLASPAWTVIVIVATGAIIVAGVVAAIV